MSAPEPFVDIHCHLIPGIDDGAKSWDETLAMARMAVEDGFGTMIVTPHQLGAYRHNTGAIIRERAAELQRVLTEHNIPLRILPGADVRIESDMVPLLRKGEVLTLADQRKHVLLELPHDIYIPLDRLLAELTAARIVGILSHPERNQGILENPRVVPPLVASGCLTQVTAGSLLGAFGPQLQRFTEDLIAQRLVHFVSTDAHGPKSRRPLLRRAFDRVTEIAGSDTALALCCRNPAAVAAGRDVVADPSRGNPASKAAPSKGFLGWRKAS